MVGRLHRTGLVQKNFHDPTTRVITHWERELRGCYACQDINVHDWEWNWGQNPPN